MKKVLLILMLLFMTGCSKQKELQCTMEDKNNDFILKQSIVLTFNDDKINTAKIVLNYKIKNKKVLQIIKNSAKESFTNYKNKKGVTFKEKSKSDNYKYEMLLDINNISDEIKANFNLNGSNKLVIIDDIQNNGYTCK